MKLIDADKLECVSATMPHEASEDYKEGYGDGMNYVLDIIDDLPTIDPVKRGKWIIHPEVKNIYGGGTYIECSECGEKYVVQYIEDEKFCRNCGARMRGEEDDNM